MRIWPLLVGVGAGAGAIFLYSRRALATEDDTGATLDLEMAKAQARTIPAAPASLGLKAVEVGLRHVGEKEDSPKSNRGPFVDQVNRGVRGDGEELLGKPWCARFARYCFEKAAEELGQPPPFAGIRGTLAAVTSWRDVFKGYEAAAPKPGAVALLLKTGVPGVDKGKRHATIVVRAEGGQVLTVEGNHRDAVAVVSRPRADFAVFLDVERYVADRGRGQGRGGEKVVGLLGIDAFALGCA